MENPVSDLPNPFAAPMEPAALTKLLVNLMPDDGRLHLTQQRLLELRQEAFERDGDELVPYKAGVSEFIDSALKPLIEGKSNPTTWLEVSKILTKAKDYNPARTAIFYAYGWPESFGDIRE